MFPDELVVIGVHSAKFPSEHLTSNIRQAVMRHGIEHPVVNDAGFKIWNAYAIRAWPTLVLIDPTGRIAGQVSGEILAEEFAKNIREVIDQNAEAIDRRPLDLRPEAQLEPHRPLRFPSRLLIAGERLFIADSGHHRIIEVQLDADGLSGEVVRVFGSGSAGLQDGPAERAAFNHPHGLGLQGDAQTGTLFVADTENHAIRAVDLQSGVVSTVAGNGQKAHGRLLMGEPTEMSLRSPWAVLPLNEYLLIAMAGSHQIWVLIKDEQLGPFAGNGSEALVDGPVGQSSFNQPSDLAFGLGYLFVADPEASAVRAISLDENPQTVTLVGQGLFDYGDEDGSTSQALLQHPVGLAFSVSDRQLYVADTYNNKIKLLDPVAGQVTTLVGSGQTGAQDGDFASAGLFEPEGLQVQDSRLYIADTNNHLIRVADLQTRQLITFRLRGIERLPVEPAPEAQAEQVAPLQVAPIQAAPGKVRLVFDALLPPGYKRNAEAPAILAVNSDGQSERRTFGPDEEIAYTVELSADQNLPVDLTLYYCQAEDAALCLIADRRLLVPLVITPGGPSEVHIPVKVDLAQQ